MKTVIKVQNISYSNCIENFSFSAKEGEIIVISGRQKEVGSAVLSLISGLISPDSGSILIGGRKNTESPLNIGYIFDKEHFEECCESINNIPASFDISNQASDLNFIMINHLLDTYGLITYKSPVQMAKQIRLKRTLMIIKSVTAIPDVILIDEMFFPDDRIHSMKAANMFKHIVCHEKKICIINTPSHEQFIDIADKIVFVK